MANFVLKTAYNSEPVLRVEKASATVIAKGDLVYLDAGGLAVVGTATSTKHAVALHAAAAGTLTVGVCGDAHAEFYCTADVNYAKAQRGLIYDVKITGAVQALNQAAQAVNVLQVSPEADGGTVGAKTNVVVKLSSFMF